MKVEIKTMSGLGLELIVSLFNKAFEGYFIPIRFNEHTLADKFRAENIIPGYSAIAYIDEIPAGFILTGIENRGGVQHAYNAGTGVVAEHREQGLTEQMYQFMLDLLSKDGTKFHQLEVITKNETARKVYERVGFSIARKLLCLRSVIDPSPYKHHPGIIELSAENIFSEQLSFDAVPSWQNSMEAVSRMKDQYRFLGIEKEGRAAGIMIFTPSSGRIKYLYVAKQWRRQGIGTALLNHAFALSENNQLSFINLDESDKTSLAFLQKHGWEIFLEQYEMIMEIKSV